MLPQDGDSFTVDADHAGPAALGGSFHALAAHYGGGAAERDLSGVQVDCLPAEVEQLAAASASVGSEPVEGIQAMGPCGGQEQVQLLSCPDAAWFGVAIPRALGSFGRVDGEQLLNVKGAPAARQA